MKSNICKDVWKHKDSLINDTDNAILSQCKTVHRVQNIESNKARNKKHMFEFIKSGLNPKNIARRMSDATQRMSTYRNTSIKQQY